MKSHQVTWAVILAGGEGSRLASLTRDDGGNHVPKQFCSLSSGRPLVYDAVQRARYVAQAERICVVVADQHRRHWKAALPQLRANNFIVQPLGRGTANGVLLATLSITQRDPKARIVFLPADHFVRDEAALGASLQEAATLIERGQSNIILVGIEPDGVDCELGYIVPGEANEDGSLGVAKFIEKPNVLLARQLLASGAVWNSFIFASAGMALLNLFRRRMPGVTGQMFRAIVSKAQVGGADQALAEVYRTLPTVDFSRDILEGAEPCLHLVTAPPCGWTDLGSPERVAGILHELPHDHNAVQHPAGAATVNVPNLAVQCQNLGLSA